MKATLTLEFDTPAALHAFVDRMRGKEPPQMIVSIPPLSAEMFVGEQRHSAHGGSATASTPQEPLKTRKPRADAGKPRGPYKKGDTTTGEPAASEPTRGHDDSVLVPQVAAPVSPTTPAAPVNPSAPATATTPTPAAAEPSTGALTIADAQAALRRMKDTKGLGTPACITFIQSFGFDKLSDLPSALYAEFIRQAKDKVAKHEADAK